MESEIALVELANMYAGPVCEPPPTLAEVKEMWEEDLCAIELTNEIEDIGSQYDEDEELEIADAEGEDDEKADLKQEERDESVADTAIFVKFNECAADFSESTVVSDVLEFDSAFLEEKAVVADSLFLDEEASQSFGGMFDSFSYVDSSTEKEKEQMTEGKKKEKMFDKKKEKKKKLQPAAKPERIRGKDADDDLFFVEESKNVKPKFGVEMRKLAATTTTTTSLAKKLPQLPQRQREQDLELERRKLDEPSGKDAVQSKTKPKGKSRDLKASSKFTPSMAAKRLVAAPPPPPPSLPSSYASLPQVPVSAPPVSRNPFSISATTPHIPPSTPSLYAQPYFMPSAAFGAPTPPMPSMGFLPSAPAALSLPRESTFRYAFAPPAPAPAPAPTPAPAAPVSPAYSLARTSSGFGSAPSPGGPPPPSPAGGAFSFGAASHSPHSMPQSPMGALLRFYHSF